MGVAEDEEPQFLEADLLSVLRQVKQDSDDRDLMGVVIHRQVGVQMEEFIDPGSFWMSDRAAVYGQMVKENWEATRQRRIDKESGASKSKKKKVSQTAKTKGVKGAGKSGKAPNSVQAVGGKNHGKGTNHNFDPTSIRDTWKTPEKYTDVLK